MNNCKVTQYKKGVNNDNLKEFGVIKFTLKGNGTSMQYSCLAGAKISCDKTFTVKQGATTLATDVYEYTFSEAGTYLLDDLYNGDSVFKYDKYKTAGFATWDADGRNNKSVIMDIGDIECLQPSTSYGKLVLLFIGSDNGIYGNLKLRDLQHADVLWRCKLHNPVSLRDNFFIDINDMNCPELTELEVLNSAAKCNVETLNLPIVTSLQLIGCPYFTGDLKIWAERMWNNGRTSGTCSIGYVESGGVPSGITWDGQDLRTASGVYYPVIHFHENEAPTLETT